MNLSLVVLAPEKRKGNVIPISVSPFLIGRGPDCHLRPASTAVGSRHCSLFVREGRVFLEDFETVNGTFLNDRQVRGVVEVVGGDHLQVGGLIFGIRLGRLPAIDQLTPPPPAKEAANAEEEIGALLLSLRDERRPRGMEPADDETPLPPAKEPEAVPKLPEESPGPQMPFGSVSSAKELLKMYKKGRQRN
jgi:predicted component of type VI protein secretion system